MASTAQSGTSTRRRTKAQERERSRRRRADARRTAAGASGAGLRPGAAQAGQGNGDGMVGQSKPPSVEELLRTTQGPGPRLLPGRAALGAAAKLALRPQVVGERGLELAGELGKILLGLSDFAPDRKDNRFKDEAWTQNFLFRRLCQAYLATGQSIDGVIADLDLGWRTEKRVRFVVENIVEALSPSNNPLLNPSVLKAVIDTGGLNFVKGARQLAGDMAHPPRIPTMVDSSSFQLGEDLALSEGQVVHRTEVFELIQYAPTTDRVKETPLLIVGAMINKFYIVDLRPERSLVEHLVGNGHQTFVISWRNPGAEQSDWNLETYASAVIEAMEAMEAICGTERTSVFALCAGAQVTSVALGHLAATDRLDHVTSATLAVAALDVTQMGTTGAFLERLTAAVALADTARKGYLDGRTLAQIFAWMRPSDLIWGYWVNNYLLGNDPPPFDVLVWNADYTNMPAGLHRDFLELGLRNALATPGGVEVLGTPIDLSTVDCDLYVVAGIDDHIVPWENAYRSALMFGSQPRFVLSNSGHIASQVNPPDNPKASYQHNPGLPEDPQEWLAGSAEHRGSWWVDWTDWLAERSGRERPAPKRLGGDDHEPLGPAPGEYVLETVG